MRHDGTHGVIVSSHRRCTIVGLQPFHEYLSDRNPPLRQLTMESLPLHKEARLLPTRPVSAQARLEIKSMEVSTLMTKRRENTDEESELIEMRYQQSLALSNLEDLFATGQLDCL
jgi:hypothetical protein